MNGILNVLKPPGMTSSDVVVDIRRLLGTKKVGHAGTLDPGAAGVLPVCVGKATRLFDFLAEKDKQYVCEITFGTSTDTIDAYGKILERHDARITADVFTQALSEFVGEQEQLPPMYSAIKYNGQKLCDLARRGETLTPEVKRRRVMIHSLQFLEQTAEQSFLFSVHCGKGTYIRSLCADIADKLQTYAYMSFLLRTRSGPFALADAHTIAELAKLKEQGVLADALVQMDSALPNFAAVEVPIEYERFLMVGNPVPRSFGPQLSDGELFRMYCGNRFFGIGRAEEELLRMKAVLID